VFKLRDQATESALCAGIVAAVVWGIGLSLYGFQQPPEQLSWLTWGVQLIAGILGCVVTPLLFVRWREWVLARLMAPRTLQEQR
jgi:Na+/melibiose symporter-like transporter